MLFDLHSSYTKKKQWDVPKLNQVSKNAVYSFTASKSETPKEEVLKALKEENEHLKPLEAKLILAIAEELILKLTFLRARFPEVSGNFDFRFLRDRGNEPYLPPYKPLTKRDINLWQWKLAWDLAQLQKVLVIMKEELRNCGSTNALQRFNQHQFDLLVEVKQYEAIIKKLSKSTENERPLSHLGDTNLLTKIQELNEKISLLEKKYIQTHHKIRVIRNYISEHELSRISQNKTKIELIEGELNKRIEDLLNEKENEELSHKMIVKFMTESIKMLKDKMNYWQTEWKRDMNDRDYEILRLEADIEEQAMKTHSLIIDYARREREIERYLVERAERLEQEKIEKHICDCTIKIQAWWRGCMVRWKLGPYSLDMSKKKKKKVKKK